MVQPTKAGFPRTSSIDWRLNFFISCFGNFHASKRAGRRTKGFHFQNRPPRCCEHSNTRPWTSHHHHYHRHHEHCNTVMSSTDATTSDKLLQRRKQDRADVALADRLCLVRIRTFRARRPMDWKTYAITNDEQYYDDDDDDDDTMIWWPCIRYKNYMQLRRNLDGWDNEKDKIELLYRINAGRLRSTHAILYLLGPLPPSKSHLVFDTPQHVKPFTTTLSLSIASARADHEQALQQAERIHTAGRRAQHALDHPLPGKGHHAPCA